MQTDKVYSLLGLAARARKAAGGEFAAEMAVRSGKAALVLLAGDASDNTKKKFRNMCEFHRTPFYLYGTKEGLGHCMGHEERAVAALTDRGFAGAVEKHLHNADKTLE